MFNYFKKAQKENNKFGMLEYVYVAIAAITIFIAGIVALFNQNLGLSIAFVPLASISIAGVNVIVWSLTKLFADSVKTKESPKTSK